MRLFLLLLFLVSAGFLAPVRGGTLVATGSYYKIHRGLSQPSGPDWRFPGYDDSAWAIGQAPFSYGDGVQSGTILADMQGRYSTLYIRTRFEVTNAAQLTQLLLRAACDDGFIAWINGTQVAWYNVAPGERPFDDHLAADHATVSVDEPVPFLSFPIEGPSVLREGENVLCVQVFNATLFSSDLFMDLDLTALISETVPPRILHVLPSSGEVTNLSQVTVTFSEPVQGVRPGDLLLNGQPSTTVTARAVDTYVFGFPPLPLGPVRATWVAGHTIRDQAAAPNPFDETAAESSWTYVLVDPNAPTLSQRLPVPGKVRQLSGVEVVFSENVVGVDAADLLVNGTPATSVDGTGAGPYRFHFPPAAPGRVELRFAAGHEIRDTGVNPLGFSGISWSVEVDPGMSDPPLVITEILAANATGVRDEDNEEQPWIEIHNRGSEAVPLANLSLSDDPDDPGAWVFPPVFLPAGAHRLVFASAKDRKSLVAGAPWHTSFKLSRQGEHLGLYNAEFPRRAISSITPDYPPQRNDVSWGRTEDGRWAYHAVPTPAAPNGGPTISQACEPVEFSVPRGFFTGSFYLVLTCPTPGARIHLTLDGSEPNPTNSAVYTEPLLVNRTLVVRAIAARTNFLPSVTRTHSYLVNLSAVQRALPAISLSTDPSNLVGPSGIVGMQGGRRDGNGAWFAVGAADYYNPIQRGIAWERPVSFEFLTPASNGEFQINAGIRLHASDWFRPRLFPNSKFSWRLYFRGDYGDGRLQHPFIPESPVEEFDVIVCRAGSNDLNPFVRDEIQRRLLADCGQVSARGTFTTLFMNGRYSGFYNPVERIEPDFLALHHGGGDDWDVLSQSGALSGDRADWDSLLAMARAGSPATGAWYQGMMGRLDVTNFVDYLLVNAYGYTGDWPHNNWRSARERKPGALWRYYIWDAEWSTGFAGRAVGGNTFTELGDNEFATLYSRLRQNPEFRLLFADRVHRHLFNGGALTGTNVIRHFVDTTAGLSGLISGLDRGITNTWVPQRPAHLRAHLVGQGLYNSSNAPVLLPHGGRVPAGSLVLLTNLSGTIWYTTDGSDPRVPFSSQVSARALRYDPAAPPVLQQSVLLRARSLQGTAWSALAEATFTVGTAGVPVRIGEILYQPVGGAAYEFVELRNPSGRPVDLSGFSFDGIEFQFPSGTVMPATTNWVLASNDNPSAFATRFPGVPVLGYFGGALNNAGEALVLRDAGGNPVDFVRFRPDLGWPSLSAGPGHSLERTLLDSDGSDPAAWRASLAVGGTPGAPTSTSLPPAPVRISEVFAANNGSILRGGHSPDFIEVTGIASGSTDLSGWLLYRADRTNRFRFPPGTWIEQGDFLVVWCGDAAADDRVSGFRLDAQAGVVVLADPTGAPRSVLSYGPQADGWSVGLLPNVATPRLLVPTPGNANQPAEAAPVAALVLNEWLANPAPGERDFVEFHNRDPDRPVFLPGFQIALSNALVTLRQPAVVPPLGFAVLYADEEGNPDSLPFRLPAAGGSLRLFSPVGNQLDQATYANAAEGVAQGRFPDGADPRVFLPLGGTPGSANLLTARPGPRFSEILAASIAGSAQSNLARDWVELVNTATNAVALGGWRIEQSGPTRRTWTAPSGMQLAAGARLRVLADPTIPASTTTAQAANTGFALADEGATLDLIDATGLLRDRRPFGPQIAGQSIGLDAADRWTLLASPTPGQPNAAAALLDAGDQVRINEWLARSERLPDFIELHNAADRPVDLGDWRLTDDPSYAGINRFRLPPLTYIAAGGWRTFVTDGDAGAGPSHAPFGLAATGEALRLYKPNSNLVDGVTLLPSTAETAAGRFPDGSLLVHAALTTPTPGAANLLVADLDEDGLPDDWETANGFNPSLATDARMDPDDDGRSNLDEYRAGTDPRDPTSVLVLNPDYVSPVLRLRFTAQPGRSYALESRPALDQPWERSTFIQPGATRRVVEIPVEVGDGSTPGFFRVITPGGP